MNFGLKQRTEDQEQKSSDLLKKKLEEVKNAKQPAPKVKAKRKVRLKLYAGCGCGGSYIWIERTVDYDSHFRDGNVIDEDDLLDTDNWV